MISASHSKPALAEFETAAAIERATEWLLSTPDDQRPRPIMVHIRAQFHLTAMQGVQAIRQANQRRAIR